MSDNNDHESSTMFWPGPVISFPEVIPTTGFQVGASMPDNDYASEWRLQVWGSSDPHYWHGYGHRGIFQIAPGDIKHGQFRMRCDYKYGGIWSNWTETPWLTMRLAQPTISSPAEFSVIWIKRPMVSGRGVIGAQVQLFHPHSGELFGQATVQNDGQWRIPELAEDVWMADPFYFAARQNKDNLDSEPSRAYFFAVLFKPVIGVISVNAMKPTVTRVPRL